MQIFTGLSYTGLLASSMRVWIVSNIHVIFQIQKRHRQGHRLHNALSHSSKKKHWLETLSFYPEPAPELLWQPCRDGKLAGLPHRFIVWCWLNRTVCCPMLRALCVMDGPDDVRYMRLISLHISVYDGTCGGWRASKHIRIQYLHNILHT